MFRNQFAQGLKGMINKISSDNSSKDSNGPNNTPKNERSLSIDSQQAMLSSTSSMSSSPLHNNVNNQSEDESNHFPNDGQEVEGFLCPLCLRAFPSPESLSEHYSSEHSDFNNSFQCNECKMKFGSQQELESHHRRHHSSLVSTDELIKREISKISSAIETEELELLRAQMKALEESKSLITNECQSLKEQLKRSLKDMTDKDNQLSQLRSSSEDSEILKKELVRVQKLMNDMSVEREKEKELLTQEIKKQMENMVNERQVLNEEMLQLKADHKQAINDSIEMRSKKEKLEVEINLLRNEGITVSSLRDDIESKCALIGKLEQNVQILTKQLESVQQLLLEAQRERDEFKEQIHINKGLESQLLQFKEKADKTFKQNIELNVKVSQLNSQLESITSKHEALNIKMKVQQEMKAVGQQLDSKLAEEVQLLKIDLITAQQNFQTSKITSNHLSDELNQIKNLYQFICEEKQQLIKKNDSLNAQLEQLEDSNHKFTQQMSRLEDENNSSKHQLENSLLAQKQITAQYNQQNIKLNQLSTQLTSKEKQFDEINKQLINNQLVVKTLEKCIQDLNHEKETALNNCEQNESQIESLKQKCVTLQNENTQLNHQLKSATQTMQTSEAQYRNDLQLKNDQIIHLNEQQIQLEQTISQLQFTSNLNLEKLNSQLNEQLQLIDSQHKSITNLNDKSTQLQNTIKLTELELQSLKDEKIKFQHMLNINESKFTQISDTYNQKCVQFDKINNQLLIVEEMVKNKDLLLNTKELEIKKFENESQNYKELHEKSNSSLIETQTLAKHQSQQIESLNIQLNELKLRLKDVSLQLKSKAEECEQKDAKHVSTLSTLDARNEEVMKIRAALEKEKSKYEMHQTQNDTLLGLKLELEAKLSNVIEEKRALIERCISSEDQCQKLKTELLQMRHKLDDSIAALHELGRENQSLQLSQTKLDNRKWADDHQAIACAKCSKPFSVTNRKHHCRNCGQIFCNDCSSKSAVLALHPKPVRVCDNCHQEMNQN